ncbi:MAG: hypothetical protein IPM15_11155 [Betaproteobacteria bacterium]|nr:hypothetical protein [Betaproteobacteria bacterium]
MVPRRSLFVLALAAACTACTSPPAAAAFGHLVQMQLVDRASGDVLPEARHRGAAWVAGRPGDRYAVRLTNRTGARVLVVLSVDGVNAVSGQTAAASQTGYVLAPWQSADITGWRKSDHEAAAFYFTALPDSYAARTDRPHNVGVVGIAVFRERVPMPRPVPFEVSPAAGGGSRSDSSDGSAGAAPAAAAPRPAAPPAAQAEASNAPAASPSPLARSERLGTGHGEREYAPVARTHFERASSRPAEIVQIRYDSHARLVAAGIVPPSPGPGERHVRPEPFPGYVPDPR